MLINLNKKGIQFVGNKNLYANFNMYRIDILEYFYLF